MDSEARKALATIQKCVEADRVIILQHFDARLARRNLMWVDVLSILEEPTEVRDDGVDERGRDKWVVAGDGADGLPIECVCAIDADDDGEITIFITLYEE